MSKKKRRPLPEVQYVPPERAVADTFTGFAEQRTAETMRREASLAEALAKAKGRQP